MHWRGLLVVTAAVLGIAAVPGPDKDKARVELGHAYYRSFCASCHEPNAFGRREASDLSKLAARRGGRFDEEELVRLIDGRTVIAAHVSREMPIWGDALSSSPRIEHDPARESITRSRIRALVAFLRSIQKPALDRPTATDP